VLKKIAIILIGILAFNLSLKAQYIHFSQFYSAPLVLAPSFTGAADGSRAIINYRDQWSGLNKGIYITSAFSFDMNVPKIKSGFGILAVRDQAGAGNLGRTDIGVTYSWYTQIARSGIFFRPGIQFKMSQRGVDLAKLVFPDQLNFDLTSYPASIQPPPPQINKFFLDATASVLFYNNFFWGGLTVDHLFRPNDAFYDLSYRVPLRYQVFGGYKFGAVTRHMRHGDNYMVSANLRYQSSSTQLDIGGYWDHEPLLIGLWIRGLPYLNITGTLNMDAIIFMLGYHIFNFTIGYSYDLTISPLLMKTGGSHEISIKYEFGNSKRRIKKRSNTLS